MDRNVDSLLDELEKSRASLTAMGATYCQVRREKARAQLAYEKAMGKEFLTMLHEANKEGKRPPAEDMRKAIAHNKIGSDVYSKFLLAEADVDATDRLIKVESSNLSGLQTELQQLRVELTHA